MRADAESLECLEAALGHRFADRGLLLRALTHSSFANEAPEAAGDNEALEFLGDAVLAFLLADTLFALFPLHGEGRLSRMRGHLGSTNYLSGVARSLDLLSSLRLGRGEKRQAARPRLLVGALEAVLAALYLDGGLEAARGFVLRHVLGRERPSPEFVEALVPPEAVDYRDTLQQTARARGLPHPRYAFAAERGPQHAKVFTVDLQVGSFCAVAEGMSKKAAAQEAARRVYRQILDAV